MTFAREVYLCTTGSTKLMPVNFFYQSSNYNFNEMYTYHGHKRFKIHIIFPQSLLHFQHAFSAFASDSVCRSRKIFDEASVCIHRGGGGIEWMSDGAESRSSVGWELDLSSCLTESFEFAVSTSLMSAHTAQCRLWHLFSDTYVCVPVHNEIEE